MRSSTASEAPKAAAVDEARGMEQILHAVKGLALGQQRVQAELAAVCGGQKSVEDALERVRRELAGSSRWVGVDADSSAAGGDRPWRSAGPGQSRRRTCQTARISDPPEGVTDDDGSPETVVEPSIDARDFAKGARNTGIGMRDCAMGASDSALGPRNTTLGARNTAMGVRDTVVDPRDSTLGPRNTTMSARCTAVTPRNTAVSVRNSVDPSQDLRGISTAAASRLNTSFAPCAKLPDTDVDKQGSSRFQVSGLSVAPSNSFLSGTTTASGDANLFMTRESDDAPGVVRESLAASFGLKGDWPKGLPIRNSMRGQSGHVQAVIRERRDKNSHFQLSRIIRSASMTSFAPDQARRRWWIIEPCSTARIYFDIISILVLMFDLTVTPYVLGWNVRFEGMVKYGTYGALAFWILDIFLSFSTGYYSYGELEMRPTRIARRYLRTWFLLDTAVVMSDVVGIILNSLKVSGGGTANANGYVLLRFVKAGRLLRVLGVLRVAHVAEVVRRIFDRQLMSAESSQFALEVVVLIFTIVWLNHLVSCLWYYIGAEASKDTGFSWLDTQVIPGEPMTYRGCSFVYQYTTAFHWSVSQMTPGSMQVFPVNSYEREFNIVCLIFGMLIFSTLVSSLSAKMMHVKLRMQANAERMGELRRFLTSSNIAPQLAVRVQKQVTERLRRNKKPKNIKQVSAVGLLSLNLRTELTWEVCKPYLQFHPFFILFEHVDLFAVKKLAREAIDFVTLEPGDSLFQPGTEATAAYVTMQGIVRYSQDPVSSPVPEEYTEEVGPHRWICEAALWSIWTHVGAVEAVAVCQLLCLSVEGFLSIIKGRGILQEVSWEYAICYHARLTTITRQAPLPNDLGVPYTDFDEIIASMHGSFQVFVGLVALHSVAAPFGASWGLAYDAAKMEEEVLARKSVLLVNRNGELERVAAVTALRLMTGDGARMLAQLGKREKGQIEASCVLPGMKVDEGEMPIDTLHRLVYRKVAPFVDSVQDDSLELEQVVEWKESEAHGLKTKYIKNIFTCALKPDSEEPEVVRVHSDREMFDRTRTAMIQGRVSVRQTMSRRSVFWSGTNALTKLLSNPRALVPGAGPAQAALADDASFPDLEVFLVPDIGTGSTVYLDAWITQEEFDLFQTPVGKNMLAAYLTSLHVSEDSVKRATVNACDSTFCHIVDDSELPNSPVAAPRTNPRPSALPSPSA